jgi:hypothetical protein
MSPNRWKSISPSQFAWEADALDFLRQGLPDHEPYLAWSNFEFLADDGTINEVDALVFTPMGFFLVEIKSRPGELTGDVHTWCWRHEGKVHTEDNPLFLANRKARKLASLLRHQKAAQRTSIPFLEALVFCSASDLRCHLQGVARTNVLLRDAPDGSRPGILQALINREALPAERAPNPRNDRPKARAVYQALEQAGIRPTQRSRRIGDYELKRLFLENPLGLFQDWEAVYRDRVDFDLPALVAELVADESVPFLPVQRYKESGLRHRAVWEQVWELQRKEDAIEAEVRSQKSGASEGESKALIQQRQRAEVGDIPVPPKYKSADFKPGPYWRLRGKLDVPKERWVSYPGLERDPAGGLVIAWAGWDHLQQARALAAWYEDLRQAGATDTKLLLVLAGVQQLLPWLLQWHNELDAEYGVRMGDYFREFVSDETRRLGKTEGDLRAVAYGG